MELESVLKPIMIFSEIFSLNKFVIIRHRTLIKFEIRRKNLFFYFRTVLLISIVFSCLIYRQYIKSIYEFQGVISLFVKFGTFNCWIPVTLCLMLGNLSSRKIVLFLNSLTTINNYFKTSGDKIDYKYCKKVSTILTIFNLLKLLLHVFPYYFNDKWTIADYLDWVIFNLPNFLIYTTTMQWITFLILIRMEFLALNKSLTDLKHKKCWISSEVYTAAYKGQLQLKSKYSTGENIKQFAMIYDELLQQSENVHSAFVWQVLIVVPSIFISIINNTFSVCLMIKRNLKLQPRAIILNVFYFLTLLEFVIPCAMVTKEAKKFVDILHDINYEERNENLDNIINSVTLQIYHQRSEFSVYGFFHLDGTLIYSVFGALTTYLVILLQFDE